jgi:predicted amidohydrolase YtcJ
LKRTADAIFLNGIVITVDSRDRVCEAVAVCGNRILAIGTSEEMKALAEADTQKIDLKGRSLVPGFIDAHCHAGSYGPVKWP